MFTDQDGGTIEMVICATPDDNTPDTRAEMKKLASAHTNAVLGAGLVAAAKASGMGSMKTLPPAAHYHTLLTLAQIHAATTARALRVAGAPPATGPSAAPEEGSAPDEDDEFMQQFRHRRQVRARGEQSGGDETRVPDGKRTPGPRRKHPTPPAGDQSNITAAANTQSGDSHNTHRPPRAPHAPAHTSALQRLLLHVLPVSLQPVDLMQSHSTGASMSTNSHILLGASSRANSDWLRTLLKYIAVSKKGNAALHLTEADHCLCALLSHKLQVLDLVTAELPGCAHIDPEQHAALIGNLEQEFARLIEHTLLSVMSRGPGSWDIALHSYDAVMADTYTAVQHAVNTFAPGSPRVGLAAAAWTGAIGNRPPLEITAAISATADHLQRALDRQKPPPTPTGTTPLKPKTPNNPRDTTAGGDAVCRDWNTSRGCGRSESACRFRHQCATCGSSNHTDRDRSCPRRK